MKCQSCADKIKNSLKDCDGITSVDVSLEKGTVLVESKLPSSVIHGKLEATGFVAVLKGYGGN